jgi:hypothetical protein
MNVGQFIERFRRDRKDEATPYLWSDAEIADDFLNDAVEEACQRAHLIEDNTSDFTQISWLAGEVFALLPAYVLKVIRVTFDGRRLIETSIDELDAECGSTWEDRAGTPSAFYFERNGTLRLYPIPTADADVKIRVSRLPVERYSADRDSEDVEIPVQWHVKLLNWMYRSALMKTDAETHDPVKAGQYEQAFEADFGYRHDANVERKHRDKSPNVVQYQSF